MKNLVYKELRLAIHPTMCIFLAMPLLMLAPNYPYYVVFMYTCLAIYFTFLIGREQNDIFYTAALPIKKTDVVKGRFATVILFELASVLISVPFAVISAKVNPNGGNAAGIEPNLAFYGLALIMLGGFNIIFIPEFYRTARKLFRPTLFSAIFIFTYIAAAETAAEEAEAVRLRYREIPVCRQITKRILPIRQALKISRIKRYLKILMKRNGRKKAFCICMKRKL